MFTGKRPFVFIVLLILAVTMIFTSCEKKPKTLTKVTVRLKWLMLAHVAAGEVTAIEKGFFKEEGLDVELRPGGREFDAIRTVPAGSDDIGVSSPDQIIMAREKGMPVKAFLAIMQENPVSIVSLKSSGIEKPEDLIGKKAAISYGTNVEIEYRALMRKLNLDMSKVEEFPYKFDMSILWHGTVDFVPGYTVNNPIISKLKGFDVNVMELSDYGISWYGNMYFTTEKYMNEHPDILKKYCRAVSRGWEYALEHPDEAVQFLVKHNPKADTTFQKEIMKLLPKYLTSKDTKEHSFGWMSKEKWEEIQNELLEQEFVKKTSEPSNYFTNKFVEQ